MITNGSVRLMRSIQEKSWFYDAKTLAVMIHLIFDANFKDGSMLKRGQLLVKKSDLARDCGVTYDELRTVFKKLGACGEVRTRTSGRMVVVTLINYDSYTGSSQATPNELPSSSQASPNEILNNTQSISERKNKEIQKKEIKNKEDIVTYDEAVDRLYNLYPSSTTRTEGSRVTLRSQKDKKKLATMLKNGETEENISYMITRYVGETDPRFLKMLSTLLNNPPDYSNRELDFSATTDDSSNWLNGRKPQE